MASPNLEKDFATRRTQAEARVTRMFKQTQRYRRQGRKMVHVKVDDLEALVITAAVRNAVAS